MQAKPLTERQRYWLEHIQSWNKSGKRMTEYARKQNLPVRAMYDAKKVLVRKGILPRSRSAYPAHFEQVQIVSPSSSESPWRIALPNGAVLEFSGTPDECTLGMILNTVARV